MKTTHILMIGSLLMLSACKTDSVIQSALKGVNQVSAAPSEGDNISAIKAALSSGVGSAVASLGVKDGFAGTAYKILMPEKLQKTAEFARKVGLDSYVNSFEASMNNAAEQAVPVAKAVFVDAIQSMSVQDALGIIKGGDNSATEYFKKTSADKLNAQFLPIVQKATASTQVTEKYKDLSNKVNSAGKLLGFSAASVDIDQYITQKASDALFTQIAQEERKIRQDPLGAASAVVRRVFSYYQ